MRKRSVWTGRSATPLFPLLPRKSPQEIKAMMERQWSEGRLTNAFQPARYFEPGYNDRGGYKLEK